MSSSDTPIDIILLAVNIGYAMLGIAFLLSLGRLLKGPTNLDRIIALDLIAGLTMAVTVLIAIDTRLSVYLNVTLCLAVISFIATVAFAKRLSNKPEETWST